MSRQRKREPADEEALPIECRYTKGEMCQMFEKAKDFAKRFTPKVCQKLVRDKDEPYFNEILNDRTEPGVMKPYEKDNHGDPRNPINQNINGLFFAPCPKMSIYGRMRYSVSPEELIISHAPKLYFSDFYCVNEDGKPHYIQLVLTAEGSEADQFCRTHLPQLDINDNPLFWINRHNGELMIRHNMRTLLVEVLFTESINIKEFGEPLQELLSRKNRKKFKRRPSKKNSQCHSCNITSVNFLYQDLKYEMDRLRTLLSQVRFTGLAS